MTLPRSLDLDPGSQGKPMNSWCVSFETECMVTIMPQRTRAMIILFMACCDAPLPNGISHIQMKDNVVYIDNLVWYPIWQKCINGKHGHQYRSISENLIRFMVSDFCLWWDLVFSCMAWLVMINSCVNSISHKCPNDGQYSKMIQIQLGPKALANLVPAI